MRNFAVVLLVGVLFPCTAFGGEYPVDKGATMISGLFSVYNSGGDLYEDSRQNASTTFTFSPSVLTFVTPNFALGSQFSYAHISQGDRVETQLAIGPKVGYFSGDPDSKVYPFLVVGFSYLENSYGIAYYHYEYAYAARSKVTASGTRFFFSAGLSLMASSHLGIIWEVTYNIDRLKEGRYDRQSGRTFGTNIGLAGFLF